MPARKSPAPKAGGAAITIRPSRDLLERIDLWIGSQREPVNRSDAIRPPRGTCFGPCRNIFESRKAHWRR